jgi:hypothetical protein
MSLVHAGDWLACDPAGLTFQVTFYSPGSTPGAVFCGPYTVTPTFTVVDHVLGFDVYCFEVPSLSPTCGAVAGWVSIQSLPNPLDCGFLWFNSETGALAALLDSTPLSDNLAFCLTGEHIPIYGACCNDAVSECQDNLEMQPCLQVGARFAPNTSCAELQPPCGELPGACCYDDGVCVQVPARLCGCRLGDANCDGRVDFDDINAFVAVLSGGSLPGCPPGNCDVNTDGSADFNDIDTFVAILGGAPAALGIYLGGGTDCSACPMVCLPGSSQENEPCYTATNGGCSSAPHVFGHITCGETICGTSYCDGATRDTDWFIVDGLTGANIFTITAEASFDLQLLFIRDPGGDCATYTYLLATALPNAVATITTSGLPADFYYVWVGPQFTSSFGCTDSVPQYWVHLACLPTTTGACCIHACHDCIQTTEADCMAIGGHWMGANVSCDPNPCLPAPQGDTCEDPYVIPPLLPFDATGNTCMFANDYDAVCPYNTPHAPDTVYRFTPSADELVDITLCLDETMYDTKAYVFEDTCSGTPIACNDDFCMTAGYPQYPFVSKIEGLLLNTGHDYYIVVDGYGTECGTYHLRIAAE